MTTEWIYHQNKECLRVTFNGVFTQKQAVNASQEWKKLFASKPGNKFIVIFNAKDMPDYEPVARAIWQKTIMELKQQIESLWVITDSKMIAAGASIMGVFTSFTVKVVDSENKIIVNSTHK